MLIFQFSGFFIGLKLQGRFGDFHLLPRDFHYIRRVSTREKIILERGEHIILKRSRITEIKEFGERKVFMS